MLFRSEWSSSITVCAVPGGEGSLGAGMKVLPLRAQPVLVLAPVQRCLQRALQSVEIGAQGAKGGADVTGDIDTPSVLSKGTALSQWRTQQARHNAYSEEGSRPRCSQARFRFSGAPTH